MLTALCPSYLTCSCSVSLVTRIAMKSTGTRRSTMMVCATFATSASSCALPNGKRFIKRLVASSYVSNNPICFPIRLLASKKKTAPSKMLGAAVPDNATALKLLSGVELPRIERGSNEFASGLHPRAWLHSRSRYNVRFLSSRKPSLLQVAADGWRYPLAEPYVGLTSFEIRGRPTLARLSGCCLKSVVVVVGD